MMSIKTIDMLPEETWNCISFGHQQQWGNFEDTMLLSWTKAGQKRKRVLPGSSSGPKPVPREAK
jgi:hypothetical protein